MDLIKPKKLHKGSTVAAVSPSWGAAGAPDIHWKYRLGIRRLKEEFGLHVTAAPNALKPEDELRDRPKLRADDINWAFQNPEIDAVFCNIGGNDSSTAPFCTRRSCISCATNTAEKTCRFWPA